MRDELGVRIGYGAGTAMTSVAQVRDEARWAEAVGFDSFWVSQVFGVDPLVALAAVGSDVPGLAELGRRSSRSPGATRSPSPPRRAPPSRRSTAG